MVKKIRREAMRQARRTFNENVVAERRWYMRRWVFALWAWPATRFVQLAVRCGWWSLGPRWVGFCRRLGQNAHRLVVVPGGKGKAA